MKILNVKMKNLTMKIEIKDLKKIFNERGVSYIKKNNLFSSINN